jgi:pilus assembly protein FimV
MDPPSTNPARKATHIKVGARATLRGIAWRVGERTESDLQRMMIALFRANPAAFDGNINRLRRGAVLTIPSQADVAAISKAEAKHEVAAQMAAWRAPRRTPATVARGAQPPAATSTASLTAASPAATAIIPAAATPTTTLATASPAVPIAAAAVTAATATSTDDASLDRRVESLEHELSDMKGLLDGERERLSSLQEQAARAERSTPPAMPNPAAMTHVIETPRSRSGGGHGAFLPVLAGLGGLAAALAALYFRLRRRTPPRNERESGLAVSGAMPENILANAAAPTQAMASTPEPVPAPQSAVQVGAAPLRASVEEPAFDGTATDVAADVQAILTSGADDATYPLLPIISGGKPVSVNPAGRSEIAGAAPRTAVHDTTVNQRIDTTMRLDSTHLDFNLVDLDLTAQHVQMPSVLNEHAVVKERRTNLADVLKMAIEREPDRHDLRMKLLELYYSAAATNRQAFLETVQKFARDRDYLQPDQWDRVASMGRQIAGENPLFAEAPADDDLADCA